MVGREPQEEIRWESRGQAVGGLVLRVKSRGLRFNWKLISVFLCFFFNIYLFGCIGSYLFGCILLWHSSYFVAAHGLSSCGMRS